MRLKKGRLVVITWDDSAGPPTYWHDDDARLDPVAVKTVGWVHSVSRRSVTLRQSHSDGGQVGGMFSIPRAAIRKVRTP